MLQINGIISSVKEEFVQNIKRCAWVDMKNPLYIQYHDEEWGRPLHDERRLFEMLILEGAQAGLSWITILKKREAYGEAFDHFDPEKVFTYGEEKIASLLANPGIVRNRLKIRGAVKNAGVFLSIQKECGSFDRYIWNFVNHRPIQNAWAGVKELPAKTSLSDLISKDLKKRGMIFVGSTIIYSFMQAIGMVNDHFIDCPWHKECASLG